VMLLADAVPTGVEASEHSPLKLRILHLCAPGLSLQDPCEMVLL